jgi:hypothetical protein
MRIRLAFVPETACQWLRKHPPCKQKGEIISPAPHHEAGSSTQAHRHSQKKHPCMSRKVPCGLSIHPHSFHPQSHSTKERFLLTRLVCRMISMENRQISHCIRPSSNLHIHPSRALKGDGTRTQSSTINHGTQMISH